MLMSSSILDVFPHGTVSCSEKHPGENCMCLVILRRQIFFLKYESEAYSLSQKNVT